MTDAALRYRARTSQWQRLMPGVFVIGVAAPSWEQRLKGAELWADGRGVLSHRAAGAVWKLDGVEPGSVELLTTSTRLSPPDGVIVHQTKMLARRDWAEYRGFRVTGLARTVFDLAAVLDPETFEAAAESAFRRSRDFYGQLTGRLNELGARGRNGAGVVRQFLANRDPGAGPTESILETRFVRLTRSAGLPPLVRQYVVRDGERFIIRLDFADPPVRFGVRLNGKGTHLVPEQWQKDQTQGNDLTLLCWTILDFTWADVRDRPDTVLASVRRGYQLAIALAVSSGLPPPASHSC
ncbi:MAG TPA: hypothetical protein VHA57_11915 [Actinomycetota bacterium]|nr:hypothetical protein [Actinomycetota bacterium]